MMSSAHRNLVFLLLCFVLCCKRDVLLTENDINVLYVLDVISTLQLGGSPALFVPCRTQDVLLIENDINTAPFSPDLYETLAANAPAVYFLLPFVAHRTCC
jgi:hypothetical protein